MPMARPRRFDQVLLRRSLYTSGALHVALIVAMLVTLPHTPPPEEPQPAPIEMDFEPSDNSGGPSAKADAPSTEPKPPAPQAQEAPPTPTPPQDRLLYPSDAADERHCAALGGRRITP